MFSRNGYITFGVILLLLFAYHQANTKQFYPFAVVQESPVQTAIFHAKPFLFRDYTVTPVAEFEIKALVLSSAQYIWGRESKLAPVDLALGWGPMSDGKVLKDLDITQGNRWYFYHYQHIPIPDGEIIAHSANMHLMPATPQIARMIKKAKKGDVVAFKGYLVNVKADDGWNWNSSLSRTDTGGHSCELVWVDEFNIENE